MSSQPAAAAAAAACGHDDEIESSKRKQEDDSDDQPAAKKPKTETPNVVDILLQRSPLTYTEAADLSNGIVRSCPHVLFERIRCGEYEFTKQNADYLLRQLISAGLGMRWGLCTCLFCGAISWIGKGFGMFLMMQTYREPDVFRDALMDIPSDHRLYVTAESGVVTTSGRDIYFAGKPIGMENLFRCGRFEHIMQVLERIPDSVLHARPELQFPLKPLCERVSGHRLEYKTGNPYVVRGYVCGMSDEQLFGVINTIKANGSGISIGKQPIGRFRFSIPWFFAMVDKSDEEFYNRRPGIDPPFKSRFAEIIRAHDLKVAEQDDFHALLQVGVQGMITCIPAALWPVVFGYVRSFVALPVTLPSITEC